VATTGVQRLVDHLVEAPVGDSLAAELADWLTVSARFRRFVEAHRDKVRKKLRVVDDVDGRRDVRAELRVAALLLADRRIELAFEPGGSTRGGPDFTIAFRGHPAFFLEVTRLRRAPDEAGIGGVVLAKLRQLPPSLPSVLLVDAGARDVAGLPLDTAIRTLRARADASDAATLSRGGFGSPRAFYQRFLRLGAVVVVGQAAAADGRAVLWTNPSAHLVAPPPALRASLAALRSGIGQRRSPG